MANKTTISPKIQELRVIALNNCMKAYGLKNIDLVNAGCGSAGEISDFTKGKRTLTDYVVDRLYDNVFKAKGVRKEYLHAKKKEDLSCMTQEDYVFKDTYGNVVKEFLTLTIAKMTVLNDAIKTVCEAENIPEPKAREFIIDSSSLSKQLEEEALRIAWSYLHRDTSPLWSLIDKK